MHGGNAASRLESAIAQIWRDVLTLDEVGPEDDFFRLGGDSLRAIEMLAAVDEVLLTQVDFPDFIDTPTVAGLAAAIEHSRLRPQSIPVSADAPDQGPPPCTFAQERLWFVDQLTGPTGAYNMPLGTRIRGTLDVDALERSLREVVRRHNALRTTFAAESGKPFQVVSDEPRFDFEQRDVTAETDPEAAAQQAVDILASMPFDLERGPLVRALLVRLAPSDHVLELVFDHTICDGWSHIVICDELARLYDGFRHGKDPGLTPPEVQYDDHARRERERLTDAVIEEKLVYWRERLAGIPAALELPTDRPRPHLPSFRGGTLRTHLPQTAADAIRSFARAQGTTLFATLLATYNVLLHRYSGQETIVVGSTSAARDRSDLKHSVGLYASTVVLRADLGGAPSFRTVVSQVRQTVLDAVAHHDLPFDRLVADLAPERDPGRPPIFQVFFAHVPRIPLAIDGAEPFDATPTKARFDLTLWVEEEAEGLDLVWEYSSDLFDTATIERLDRHFLRLLEAAIVDPDRAIGELPLIDEAERRRVLEEWNDTAIDYPFAALHELFEAQVSRTPEAVAVTYEGNALTYRELDERANRLACRLQSLGVVSESLVGLCLDRSLELVVGLLAVLKAGGAYVPMDPDYPAERVAFMLEDADVPVLLTQERLLDQLPEHRAQVFCLDRDWPTLALESAVKPAVAVGADDIAYVIYTSGSTGKPKGAANTHGGIVNRLFWMQDAYGLDESDRVLQKTPFSFDVSVWEFFWPLLTGARLVVARPGGHRDPGYLADVIEQEHITTVHFVPSMLQPFVEFAPPEQCRSLRRVICSGEALPGELVARFFERFAGELHNLYGPTEAAVDVTAWRCRREGEPSVVPIGRPIANTQIYILDDRGEPVPVGVAGELYIGGVQVARGYLNRPDLTAARFLPNPFHAGSLYRTGDLARWTAAGVIEYLGRLDDQVKVRGFRIELGEIQAVLTEHEAVAESAVIAFEATPGDTRLAAYVVPREGAASDELPDELLMFLASKLPAFMVPSSVTLLQRLPLTPSGKLDRAGLPAPASPAGRIGDRFVAPTTATERRIAEIWEEIVGVEGVGATDHFFRLGGHSLLAVRVVSKVTDEFEVDLSVRVLFEHPVLASFAGEVDGKRALGGARAPAVEAAPVRHTGTTTHPLSFQQRQLLFLDDLTEGGATYNAALAFRVTGPVHRDALARALEMLIERHEALRTVFRVEDDSAEQVVLDGWQVDVPIVDATDGDDEVDQLLREYARRPFDLSRDLMLRTSLFRFAPDDHIVLFQTHHVAFDAWAVEIFLRELALAYQAVLEDGEHHLPPLGLQYRDFAHWQRELLTGDRLERETSFWRRYLAGAPTFLQLPADRPRPDAEIFEAGRHTIELPQAVADDLRSVCDAEGVTPYMLLLAVFATLLYRETGQDDLLFGGPSANRGRAEFDGIIGFFANTIVTRVQLGGNPAFREVLVRVRQSVLEALEHQVLPFERVVELVRPPRRTGVNPLFQVNFRTRIGPPPTLELAGATAVPIPIEVGLARFDLAFEAHVRDDGIGGEFFYATALFDRTRVERLAAAFESLLEDVLADPSRRILAFELPAESVAVQSKPQIRGFRGGRKRQPDSVD